MSAKPPDPIDIATLSNADLQSSIIDIASRRLDVSNQIEYLKNGEDNPNSLDELSSQLLLLLMANRLTAVSGNTDLEVPFVARISQRTTTSLSIAKLMERGVTTDDLEYATKKKTGVKFVKMEVVKEKKQQNGVDIDSI